MGWGAVSGGDLSLLAVDLKKYRKPIYGYGKRAGRRQG